MSHLVASDIASFIITVLVYTLCDVENKDHQPDDQTYNPDCDAEVKPVRYPINALYILLVDLNRENDDSRNLEEAHCYLGVGGSELQSQESKKSKRRFLFFILLIVVEDDYLLDSERQPEYSDEVRQQVEHDDIVDAVAFLAVQEVISVVD